MACIEISWNICHHDNPSAVFTPLRDPLVLPAAPDWSWATLWVNPTCQKENDRELVDGSSCTNDSLLMWTYVGTVGFLMDHDGTLWKISVRGWTNEANMELVSAFHTYLSYTWLPHLSTKTAPDASSPEARSDAKSLQRLRSPESKQIPRSGDLII